MRHYELKDAEISLIVILYRLMFDRSYLDTNGRCLVGGRSMLDKREKNCYSHISK
jgi:hypothetical protein